MDSSITDFSRPFDRSNVTFIFDDGKRLHFNRGTLGFFSPVFAKMLLGDWKEGSDETVPLPLKSSEDFHTVLRLVALHDEKLITDANVAALLRLASEYLIRNVSIYCNSYMLKLRRFGPKRFTSLECELQVSVLRFGLRATLKKMANMDFSKPFDRSNVTFVFDDGKRLYFNRGALSFFSPVFDRMLLGDWKEGRDEAVPLPLKSFDDFRTVLHLVARHDEELITDTNVTALLSLADEYEIRNVSIYCSSYMLKHWKIGPKRFEALELALEFDLRMVTEVLLPAIVGSSLADLKVAAEALSPKVYAVVMQLRAVRLGELSRISFILQCYPLCYMYDYDEPFVCYWCREGRRRCATGHCADDDHLPSTCNQCNSRVGDFCYHCRRRRCEDVEGKICICGVNCNYWYVNRGLL